MKRFAVVCSLSAVVCFGCITDTFASFRGLGSMSSLGRLGGMQRQLFWTSSTNKVTGYGGQGLPYSETDGTQGAFAQLIWVGPNGTRDPFDPSDPDGTGNDDVVVDITFSYGAVIPGTKSNQFADVGVPLSDIGAAQNGSNYYVRVYNAPNPNYNAVGAPITGVVGITYYYESDIHAYDHKGGTQPDIWNFTGGTDQSTQLQLVPEPTTMGLMAVGALALVASRRRRKS